MEETFRVEFLGFVGPRPDDGYLVLASAFGLSEEQAKLLVVTAPRVVATGVTGKRLDALFHALSAVKVRLVTTNEETGEKKQHPPGFSLPLPGDEQPTTIPPASHFYEPSPPPEETAKPPVQPRRRSSGHYASVGAVKSDKIPPRRNPTGGHHQASVRSAPSGGHPNVRSNAPSGSHVGADSRPKSGGYEQAREGQTSDSLPMILQQIERSGSRVTTDGDLSIETVFEDAGDGLVPPDPPPRPRNKPKRPAAKKPKKQAVKRAKSRSEKYRIQVLARSANRSSDSRGRFVMLIVAGIVVLGCLIYLVL